MGKPRYVYHGDRNHLEELVPRQIVGFGGEPDCRNAVYAVDVKELAIPFAITFVPTARDAMFSVDTESMPPRIRLKNTAVRWKESVISTHCPLIRSKGQMVDSGFRIPLLSRSIRK